MNERVAEIKLWHKRRGLDKPWPADRFNRLCRMLECTPGELGAIVGVYNWKLLSRWLEANAIPPYVALSLQMIEDAYMQVKHGAIFEPVMPVHIISNG